MRDLHHRGCNIPRQRQARRAKTSHGADMTNDHRTRKTWKSVLVAIVVIAVSVAFARFGHPGHGMWDGPL
jgi:hypothetical protein